MDDLTDDLRAVASRAKSWLLPSDVEKIESAVDRIDDLTAHLWSMAANRAPRHPNDTHVEVLMPIAVWEEFRP